MTVDFTSLLLAPELWTPGRKPSARLEINQDHPLARKLVFCAIFGDALAPRDLVTGRQLTPIASPSINVGPAGKVAELSNTDRDAYSFVGLEAYSGTDCGLEAVAKLDSHDPSGSMIFAYGSVYYQVGTGSNCYISSGSVSFASHDPDDGEYHHLYLGEVTDEVYKRVYVDGVDDSFSLRTKTSLTSAQKTAYIGRYSTGSSWDWNGSISYFRLWKGMTRSDVQLLARDPYGARMGGQLLFQPAGPKWLMIGTGVGGDLVLSINDSAHTHAADEITLTQAHQLAVAESSHGHAADNIALTQAHALSVVDSAHGHAADNIDLSVSQELAVAEATHGHASDNIDLTQAHQLAIAESTHGHTAENVVLQAAGTLAVQDSLHGHAADDIALTQAHVLAIAESAHSHAAENLSLDSSAILTILDGAHGHTADNIALTQTYILSIQDALHNHAAENVGLEVDHATLIISDALHAHLADQCNVSEQITVIETPGERIFMIQAEGRVIAVSAGPRAFPIQ